MVALEDVESQKKGLVLLAYNVDAGGLSKMDPMGIPSGVKFMAAIPMRITAVHFCYNDPATSPFLTLTKYVIGRESRLRFRTHYGKSTEFRILYKLPTPPPSTH